MNASSLFRFATVPLLVACPATNDPGNPPTGSAPAKPSSFAVSAATATSLTLS